ncbi:MAG: RNA polymerase sigma-70 factor [Bacteroidota bacterium]
MTLNSLSDSDLWALIVPGDYRAFTVLYERHWLKLYKTAQKYIRDNEACEEIVHDLFVTLWNRRCYLNILDFNHYLKAATRYQVYAHLKRAKTSQIIYCEELFEDIGSYELNQGQEKMLYTELEQQLTEQLRSLPERCREIFLLSRKEHLSNMEIAERLSISKRSVENQITAALKHLRYHLKDIALIVFILTITAS